MQSAHTSLGRARLQGRPTVGNHRVLVDATSSGGGLPNVRSGGLKPLAGSVGTGPSRAAKPGHPRPSPYAQPIRTSKAAAPGAVRAAKAPRPDRTPSGHSSEPGAADLGSPIQTALSPGSGGGGGGRRGGAAPRRSPGAAAAGGGGGGLVPERPAGGGGGGGGERSLGAGGPAVQGNLALARRRSRLLGQEAPPGVAEQRLPRIAGDFGAATAAAAVAVGETGGLADRLARARLGSGGGGREGARRALARPGSAGGGNGGGGRLLPGRGGSAARLLDSSPIRAPPGRPASGARGRPAAAAAAGAAAAGAGRKGAAAGEERGLVGLQNLGNTCFMNSCLQCLLNTEGLVAWFLGRAWGAEVQRRSPMKGQVARAFADLAGEVMGARRGAAVSPAALKRVAGKWAPQFVGYAQQDAQEFLRFLLDGLGEDVRRDRRKPSSVNHKDYRAAGDSSFLGRYLSRLCLILKSKPSYPERKENDPNYDLEAHAEESWQRHLYLNDSYITELFCGQLLSQVECLSCRTVSNCFDPFLDLSVPIPKANQVKERAPRGGAGGMTYPGAAAPPPPAGRCTLGACLRAFAREEVLDGEDKYGCGRCGKRRKGVKQLRVHRFPPYLVVHLKRFQVHGARREKLGTAVDFPLRGLDLGEVASPHPVTVNGLPPIYDLYAISNHMGGLGGGHYTAHCENRMSQQWYTFNDSLVTPIVPSSIQGSDAYVLFYKQQGLPPPPL